MQRENILGKEIDHHRKLKKAIVVRALYGFNPQGHPIGITLQVVL
jgi:hypothetical protein